jgi:hypothetical protein
MQFEDFGIGGINVASAAPRAVPRAPHSSLAHQTNLDICERIIPGDVKRDAPIIAAGLWHGVNCDQMIPRLP